MTSRNTIKTFAKRCGYAYDSILQMDVNTVLENLKDAYKEQRKNKHLFNNWRKEFNYSLINALVKDENLTAEIIKKRMKRKEESREMGQKSRKVTGRGFRAPILSAIITDENNNERELCSQQQMAPAMAKSNKERKQQSLNTNFMQEPLLSEFGFLADETKTMELRKRTGLSFEAETY